MFLNTSFIRNPYSVDPTDIFSTTNIHLTFVILYLNCKRQIRTQNCLPGISDFILSHQKRMKTLILFSLYSIKMNAEQHASAGQFDLIKDNPEALLSYVDKYVKVQLIKNTSFSGFLHSIDPITLSVILSIPQDGNYKTTLIPGHAITDILEETPSINMVPPPRKCVEETTESNIAQRKAQLTAWFTKNLLPVKEDGDNLIIGNVSVLSPYGVTDICAETPVVALQIRKLLESMPQD